MKDPRFQRYVAIGDSSTEGLEDPDGRGGYRGWSRRLAAHLEREGSAGLQYANLAIRGRRTKPILDEQLTPALAMEPDLVTLFCGTNDAVAREFDVAAFAADLDEMQGRLVAAGATVLGFTMPDLRPILSWPLVRRLEPRMAALNGTIREVSARNGALVVDFEKHPVASDPRLWHADRLHANALGHERIAGGLAFALGLTETHGAWARPLPPTPRRGPVRIVFEEMRWWASYFVPWLIRHARGRSSGDGRRPSQPELTPFEAG